MNLGNAQVELNQIGAAKESYSQVLKVDPGNKEAHENLAIVLANNLPSEYSSELADQF